MACACAAVVPASGSRAASLVPLDDKPPEATTEALQQATTRAQVRALEADVDAYVHARPAQHAAGDLLLRLSWTWFRVGDYRRAAEVLRRLSAGWPETHGGAAWLGLAEAYDRLGDDTQVVVSLEHAVGGRAFDTHRDVMDADNTSNMAVRWLGGIYERRRNWKRARAVYESWKPISWCGNEREEYENERWVHIALLDARLGRAREAAAVLKKIMAEPGINGFDLRVALAYVEVAAGRRMTAAARREVARLESPDRENRVRLRDAFRMADRYEARDAAGVLDAVTRRLSREPASRDYEPPEGPMAARLLAELGAPAQAELSRRIGTGDLAAIRLAGLMRDRSLLADLKARRRAETNANLRAALADAVARVAHDTSP
jgi:tetratricopeptide (TPR) repeat protein